MVIVAYFIKTEFAELMKKIILYFFLFIVGLPIIIAQERADQQHLIDPNSFSMILFGDPQGYIKYDINQPIFDLCTAWVADNIDNLNIKAVLITGDLVEQNENIVIDRNMLNQTSREMWESLSRSLERLDNKIPYIISTGNHDYGYKNAENSRTYFPDYIPFERNAAWRNLLISSYPNRNGVVSLENAAFEFKLPNWDKLLIITTEFAPRDEVLLWAKKLVENPHYEDYIVIFMTHSFLRERTAERILDENYSIYPHNWGQGIWDKLIAPAKNIYLVICGHAGKPGSFEDSVAYRYDKNNSGKIVHQMMFNVQTLGGGWEGNGGDGWIRILEFMPDGKTIKVRTYSPLFGISPSTKHLAHRKELYDQFDIIILR